MGYRRSSVVGGTYFFTVNLADRSTDTLVRHVDELREVMNQVKETHPFSMVVMVVLPEHLQAIWRLPPGDADYPIRWSLVKSGFSRRLERCERIRASRAAKRERGIWQRRYWEHQIRDKADLARHVDYIHFNPVKHGWVLRPADWPHSTLHGYIERETVPADWGGGKEAERGDYGERETLGFLRQLNLHELYRGYQLGWELSIGRNLRIAPFGNRTGHPTGRFPHYHRRGVDPATGQTRPGQGIGRHRPWHTRSTDRSYGDRF